MSVLGILQNAYTRDEETARQLEEMFADPRIRGRMQHRRKEGLFDGRNHTGLTIKRIFGDLVYDIWWENASPRWGWESKHKFPADLDHLRRVCEEQRPSIVLAFGKVASEAARDLQGQLESPLENATLILGPHPAARHPEKFAELRTMHMLLMAEAQFDRCHRCQRWTTGGSHCSHCCAPLDGEAAS